MIKFLNFFRENTKKPKTGLVQKQKEKIEIKNLIYQNQKKSEKKIKKEREKFKKHVLFEVKKAKTERMTWIKMFEKDKSSKKRLKTFWQTDEKRHQFLKKLGISVGIGVGLTLLCIFYPPAIAPIITGLSVVAITSLVRKAFSSSKTAKKSAEVLKKISSKDKIEARINQQIETYIYEKTKNINSSEQREFIKNKFIEEAKKTIFSSSENLNFDDKNFLEKKKILEENQSIQEKIIENFYLQQKNIFNKLLKEIKDIEQEFKTSNSKNPESSKQKSEQKYIEKYQELTNFLQTHGLIRQVLGQISKPEKLLNHLTSDLALSIYLTISVGLLIFLIKKVPKTPSGQTSGATIIVEDFSKQLSQLFFVSCFGNLLAYPDSWRKAVVDYYNQTQSARFMEPNTYEVA